MVLKAFDNLKQLWESLRLLSRSLTLFRKWHLEVSYRFKPPLEASSDLKQLWEGLK